MSLHVLQQRAKQIFLISPSKHYLYFALLTTNAFPFLLVHNQKFNNNEFVDALKNYPNPISNEASAGPSSISDQSNHPHVDAITSVKLSSPFWRDTPARYLTVAELNFNISQPSHSQQIRSAETMFNQQPYRVITKPSLYGFFVGNV